ncbi:ATP-dependent RNA helicase a-like protein [Plakobranchus ocellatus]|uniref:ATP-dependent RNA helicase a-like protein n=1 Tax=Plakobranchus ocellatus TaxID=259542 RepID=A0AAV4BKZ0_9GAST|nr:ATP-dependent RNA helicase a-like protein [Plakobranchus ocellatus]
MCTIAASTTFPEPFIVPTDRRRLGWVHKNMAGSRASDHVALLNAFQMWEDARFGGENAEMSFCDNKSLNMQTLRMTWEAKNQLVEILTNAGFPEECLMPQAFNFAGPDNRLDIIRTRAVSCKQMTNVYPVQLLLFGSGQVKGHGDNVVLDNWINLKMEASLAAKIVALRPPLEALVVLATKEPEQVSTPVPQEENILGVIRALSRQHAGGMAWHMEEEALADVHHHQRWLTWREILDKGSTLEVDLVEGEVMEAEVDFMAEILGEVDLAEEVVEEIVLVVKEVDLEAKVEGLVEEEEVMDGVEADLGIRFFGIAQSLWIKSNQRRDFFMVFSFFVTHFFQAVM